MHARLRPFAHRADIGDFLRFLEFGVIAVVMRKRKCHGLRDPFDDRIEQVGVVFFWKEGIVKHHRAADDEQLPLPNFGDSEKRPVRREAEIARGEERYNRLGGLKIEAH